MAADAKNRLAASGMPPAREQALQDTAARLPYMQGRGQLLIICLQRDSDETAR